MLITRLFGWGMGIIHTPPSQHTFNTTPPPTLPQYVYNTYHYSPSHPFINHAITFSYTYPSISITTSYSMVGCEVVRNAIAQ